VRPELGEDVLLEPRHAPGRVGDDQPDVQAEGHDLPGDLEALLAGGAVKVDLDAPVLPDAQVEGDGGRAVALGGLGQVRVRVDGADERRLPGVVRTGLEKGAFGGNPVPKGFPPESEQFLEGPSGNLL